MRLALAAPLIRPQATPRRCAQPHRGSRARCRPLTRAQTVVPGSDMAEVYDALAQRVRALVDGGPPGKQCVQNAHAHASPRMRSPVSIVRSTLTTHRPRAGYRHLIAVAGAPGAGKSTLATEVCPSPHCPSWTDCLPSISCQLEVRPGDTLWRSGHVDRQRSSRCTLLKSMIAFHHRAR
jgi:hypothetical protein